MEKFVLYADDDVDDRACVQETCSRLGASLAVSFLQNGQEVLDFLQPLSTAEMPALIVLDLNMPKLDGRQTLKRLKGHPRFGHIPVAIVSTSSSNLDREACQYLGADLYLSKPHTFTAWQTILQQLIPFVG